MPISELIGVAFDENSTWGQLTIGELKCLIHLALTNHEEAKQLVEMFLAFNDNLPERKKFYQVVDIILDIKMRDDLNLENYRTALKKMYGEQLFTAALQTVNGELRFYGLTETGIDLKGIDKHLRLIESYEKLQSARKNFSP